MFDIYCEGHGARVLLWSDCITGVVNEAGGIVLRWRCPCGQEGNWHTGQSASTAPAMPREARCIPS